MAEHFSSRGLPAAGATAYGWPVAADLLIGCSGFDYADWRGAFYPRSVAAGDRLAFYARHFRTLELNVTFYRMPAADAFRKWAAAVPDDFVFAVKASRYLTHIRRLREPREPVEFLMERASLLGRHLGPILLQLPPTMKIDLERMDETLQAFGRTPVAVEVRDESWFTPEFEKLLRDRSAALCLADRRGPLTPIWKTTDWTYVRFHEGRSHTPPCYGEASLQHWAERLRACFDSSPRGYVYFNNDARACAVRDARRLAKLLDVDLPAPEA